MMNFDSWEAAARPPEDYLMHFRTRGSKNGVRRYQNPDGSWTELGLRERRVREGWGDSKKERRAERAVAKAERRLARSEKRAARKEARAQKQFEKAEKKRKSKLSGLTDEEMKAKLERARMEHEYKELTQNKSLLEAGANAVSKYLEYKDNKAKRIMDMNRMKVDMARAKADVVRAKEGTKRAKEEAKKAMEERRKTEADVKGGLRLERKKDLIKQKEEYKNYTIRGGISKRINAKLSAGMADKYKALRKAEGEAEVNRYKSDEARSLKKHKERQARRDEKKAANREYREARKEERSNIFSQAFAQGASDAATRRAKRKAKKASSS